MKHYFVQTDCTFSSISDWITHQSANGHLNCPESCEVTLPHISGSDDANQFRWRRMYDFSRTAAVTLRYMMLKGANILHLHNPATTQHAKNFYDANMNINATQRYLDPMNVIAANPLEAQWLSAHFDMLFPHFYLEYMLKGIQPGRSNARHLPTNQLVVIDTRNHVIWQIIAAFNVTRLYRGRLNLQAYPMVTINRFTFNRWVPEYPECMQVNFSPLLNISAPGIYS